MGSSRVDKGNGQRGKLKVRVVDFEVEGDDATLQDALRTIGGALTTRPAPNGTRMLSSAKSPAPAEHVESSQGELPFPTEAEAEAEADPEASEQSTTQPQRPRPSPKPRQRKVIALDLTSGDVPLKAFCEQKKPGPDTERFLVIAVWLKEHRQFDEISIDHLHTAYKHLGWNTPNNPAQVLTDLKRKKEVFFGGKARGAYSINHIGENLVRDMGKSV